MEITIIGLLKERHDEIVFELTERYYNKLETADGGFDCYDVVLSDAIILKTRDDGVTLDLGGKLASINANEFKYIDIS